MLFLSGYDSAQSSSEKPLDENIAQGVFRCLHRSTKTEGRPFSVEFTPADRASIWYRAAGFVRDMDDMFKITYASPTNSEAWVERHVSAERWKDVDAGLTEYLDTHYTAAASPISPFRYFISECFHDLAILGLLFYLLCLPLTFLGDWLRKKHRTFEKEGLDYIRGILRMDPQLFNTDEAGQAVTLLETIKGKEANRKHVSDEEIAALMAARAKLTVQERDIFDIARAIAVQPPLRRGILSRLSIVVNPLDFMRLGTFNKNLAVLASDVARSGPDRKYDRESIMERYSALSKRYGAASDYDAGRISIDSAFDISAQRNKNYGKLTSARRIRGNIRADGRPINRSGEGDMLNGIGYKGPGAFKVAPQTYRIFPPGELPMDSNLWLWQHRSKEEKLQTAVVIDMESYFYDADRERFIDDILKTFLMVSIADDKETLDLKDVVFLMPDGSIEFIGQENPRMKQVTLGKLISGADSKGLYDRVQTEMSKRIDRARALMLGRSKTYYELPAYDAAQNRIHGGISRGAFSKTAEDKIKGLLKHMGRTVGITAGRRNDRYGVFMVGAQKEYGAELCQLLFNMSGGRKVPLVWDGSVATPVVRGDIFDQIVTEGASEAVPSMKPAPAALAEKPGTAPAGQVTGLIGKLFDKSGRVVEGGISAVVTDDGKGLEIRHKDIEPFTVPFSIENGRLEEKTGEEIQMSLRSFIDGRLRADKGAVPGSGKRLVEQLLERLKTIDSVIALADNDNVKGVFGKDPRGSNVLYLNRTLLEHPLALIHEMIESMDHNDLMDLLGLPPESALSNHTAARGVGRDVRRAFGDLIGLTGRETPQDMIALLEKVMRQPYWGISEYRRVYLDSGLSESEKALIAYNAAQDRRGEQLLWGVQDLLDDVGNEILTNAIDIAGRGVDGTVPPAESRDAVELAAHELSVINNWSVRDRLVEDTIDKQAKKLDEMRAALRAAFKAMHAEVADLNQKDIESLVELARASARLWKMFDISLQRKSFDLLEFILLNSLELISQRLSISGRDVSDEMFLNILDIAKDTRIAVLNDAVVRAYSDLVAGMLVRDNGLMDAFVSKIFVIPDTNVRVMYSRIVSSLPDQRKVFDSIVRAGKIDLDFERRPDMSLPSSVSEIFPFSAKLFNKDNMAQLLKLCSLVRMVYDYRVFAPDDRTCLQYAYLDHRGNEAKMLSFKLYTDPLSGKTLWYSPVTESFRRHLFFCADREGNILKASDGGLEAIELKMFGEKPGKQFVATTEWSRLKPDLLSDDAMSSPLYGRNIWGSFDLYGVRRDGTGVSIFRYTDGLRVMVDGAPPNNERWQIVDFIALSKKFGQGADAGEIKRYVIKEIYKKVLKFMYVHGYVGLRPVSGSVSYKDKEIPISEAAKTDDPDLRASLDKLIIDKMNSNTDMHGGNFKLVPDADSPYGLRVVQVGDTDGFMTYDDYANAGCGYQFRAGMMSDMNSLYGCFKRLSGSTGIDPDPASLLLDGSLDTAPGDFLGEWIREAKEEFRAEFTPKHMLVPAGSAIGKIRDNRGKSIEGGIQARLANDRRSVIITHADMDPITVPLYLHGDEPKIKNSGDMLRWLEGFFKDRQTHYLGPILSEIQSLFKEDASIMALADNEAVQGVVGTDQDGRRVIFLSNSLINHPLALLHEYIEGMDHARLMSILGLGPDSSLTNHTASRGAGKDVRSALRKIKGAKDMTAAALIRALNRTMTEKNFPLSETRNRKAPLTASEEALIRFNAQDGLRGKMLLWGLQDRFDADMNAKLTETIQDLGRGKNIPLETASLTKPLEDPDKFGNKAFMLSRLNKLGINIPAAVAVNVHGAVKRAGELRKIVAVIEKESQHARYGVKGARPLLLSVRSSPAESAPGRYDTVLNIGMNDEIAVRLARSAGEDFAYQLYVKFLQQYAETVAGISRADRPELFFSEPQGKTWKAAARDLVKDLGRQAPPQDPYEQLRRVVNAVDMRMKKDQAGGGIVIQEMVFGNRDERSMSGVVFTRHPETFEKGLFGRYKVSVQGDGVVMGREGEDVSTLSDKKILDQLSQIADMLEREFKCAQDIEFTVESGRLYILQARRADIGIDGALAVAADMFENKVIDKDAFLAASVGTGKPVEYEVYSLMDPKGAGLEVVASGSGVGRNVAGKGELVRYKKDLILPSDKKVILYAEEIDEMVLNLIWERKIGGLVCQGIDRYSHPAILARGRCIPLVILEMKDAPKLKGSIGSAVIAATDDRGGGAVYAVSDDKDHLITRRVGVPGTSVDIEKIRQDVDNMAMEYPLEDIRNMHTKYFKDAKIKMDKGDVGQALEDNFYAHFLHLKMKELDAYADSLVYAEEIPVGYIKHNAQAMKKARDKVLQNLREDHPEYLSKDYLINLQYYDWMTFPTLRLKVYKRVEMKVLKKWEVQVDYYHGAYGVASEMEISSARLAKDRALLEAEALQKIHAASGAIVVCYMETFGHDVNRDKGEIWRVRVLVPIAQMSAPEPGAIGKVMDDGGNVVEGGLLARMTKDRKSVEVLHNGNPLFVIPFALDETKMPITMSGKEVAAAVDTFMNENAADKKEALPRVLQDVLTNLMERLARVSGVIALQDNKNVKGLYGADADGNEVLFLNRALMDHPLALIHEYIEGIGHAELMTDLGLAPESALSNHTASRGAGKDACGAFAKIKDPGSKDAKTIIAELRELMERTRPLTPSEEALILFNGNVLKVSGEKLLWGFQDFLDPVGNLRFTQEIRELTDSMRRGVTNTFLIPKAGQSGMDQAQQKIGQQARSIFEEKYNLKTRVKHYTKESLISQLQSELEQARKNKDAYHKIFVECVTQSQVEAVKLLMTGEPDAARYIVIGFDELGPGREEAVVDEMKVILVGSALLNDKRLRQDFELNADNKLVMESRQKLVEFLIGHNILEKDFKGLDLTARANLDNSKLLEYLLSEICIGKCPLTISMIDFNEIDDFNRVQREILSAV